MNRIIIIIIIWIIWISACLLLYKSRRCTSDSSIVLYIQVFLQFFFHHIKTLECSFEQQWKQPFFPCFPHLSDRSQHCPSRRWARSYGKTRARSFRTHLPPSVNTASMSWLAWKITTRTSWHWRRKTARPTLWLWTCRAGSLCLPLCPICSETARTRSWRP